ncbi:MAG TPA: hypothetical protein VGM44_16650 [Polyangiaceae bacterium]|jgi:hypothetical protein
MLEPEPISFDRALRDAANALERRSTKGEPASDALPAALLDDETLAWLRELGTKDPLAPALERWLLRLREQAELAPRRAELGRAHRAALHHISAPADAHLPLATMLELALTRAGERAAYLKSYFASAGDLGELVARLWEERQLFAERVKAPLDSFEVVSPALVPAAREFLNATRPAFETLEVHDAATFLGAALAESANEGWPAHLSARTVSELLPRQWSDGLRVRPFRLPRAIGGASFLLALSELGRALADATSEPRSPFVLARDVFDLRRNEFAALLAAATVSPAFATRQLGLGAARARDQVRVLAHALLVDARVAAFRVLLRELLLQGPSRVRREIAELSHGSLGFELPHTAVGAFVRVRPRDSQRFAASLQAQAQTQILIDSHDEDWFRNPRAIRELSAEFAEPRQSDVSAASLELGVAAFRARVEPLL